MADEGSRWGVASLERRHHPRLNVSLPVEFVVRTAMDDRADGGPVPAPAAIRNVSRGGLLLVVPKALWVGAVLDLTVHLPEQPAAAGPQPPRAVRAEAVVVWVDLATEGVPDECRCGVSFARIADADRAAILDFIARSRKP